VREHGISIILSNFSLSTSWRSCSETAAERKSTGFGAGRRVLGPEENLRDLELEEEFWVQKKLS
jgi:hypothetical protein